MACQDNLNSAPSLGKKNRMGVLAPEVGVIFMFPARGGLFGRVLSRECGIPLSF